MKDFKPVISSPFRWAGSKKRLLNEMLNLFDNTKKIYIEVFLGSGVVLINLLNNKDLINYEKYIVNDSNENIISFYKLLQTQPKVLIRQLRAITRVYNTIDTIEEKEKFFYLKRERFNSIKMKQEKIVLFWFLMKTGFNGVYRENSKGKFNVPFGKKQTIKLDEENLHKISELIVNVEFNCSDYEQFMIEKKSYLSKNNSFVYLDPPYLPEDKAINKTHILYSQDRFNHERFKKNLVLIGNNHFMISMSYSKKAKTIYGDLIKKSITDVIRTINPNKNIKSKEVAFMNYKTNKLVE